jgi:hypothetical protein
MNARYLSAALQALYPTLRNLYDYAVQDDGNGPYLKAWLSTSVPQPTEDQLTAACSAAEASAVANAYRAKRSAEYPPITDLADGIAKQGSPDATEKAAGDAQVAAYQAACLAVKVKYPKPT